MSEQTETKQNFEQSLDKLEGIVKQLEEGQLSLEDSVKLFESGMGLFKSCRQKLDEAEAKIEKIMSENAPEQTEPFELPDESQG